MQAFSSIAPATVGAALSPETTWAWLRDGTPVRIRSIDAADLELERGFVNGLSRESSCQRLMSGRNLLPGELERWTDIDRAREIALIAVASVDGIEQELGDAHASAATPTRASATSPSSSGTGGNTRVSGGCCCAS